jgi:hypothetical protein
MRTIVKKRAGTVRKAAKKVTPGNVRATINEIGKARKETEAALKEAQRIAGDLGAKFGDEAESALVSGLQEKFKQLNFDFDTMSRNRKINNAKHDIRAGIDAFLKNGSQTMAVEVKAKLQKADTDSRVKRMEKLRRYADLYGDKRACFGAMAATR